MRLPLPLLLLAAVAPAGASTILVDSAFDIAASDGRCTLREAIIAANSNQSSGGAGECAAGSAAGQDSIKFEIPGAGPHTITLQGALSDITSSLAIEGYTQPGAEENTVAGLTAGFDAVLMIRLTGVSTANGFPALRLVGPGASNVLIRGLEIFGLSSQGCCADTAIALAGSTSNVEIAGNVLRNNAWRGIFMNSQGTPHQGLRIGGPLPAQRNLIHGHLQAQGIALTDCHNCVVENNWLGVRAQAGLPVAAGNQVGIEITGSPQSLVRDNWIAGNSSRGVVFYSNATGTALRQNLIGGSIPNATGVLLYDNAGFAPVANLIAENLITGNTGHGVAMLNNVAGMTLVDNVVRGNRIWANGGLEIELGASGGPADGVNANDAGDVDQGPNGRQNFPVLAPPVINGSQFSVGYAIDSTAAAYVLEFAFASQCDPSGHGLAGQMLSDPVVLDAMAPAGTAQFALPAVPASGFVVALASGNDGTSEYSACQPYVYVDAIHASGFE